MSVNGFLHGKVGVSVQTMFQPESLAEILNADFDEVIDVRSPSEFDDDHVPGAVNLPVLDCEERVLVGEIYNRESRFRAKRVGAALVAKNIAGHLEGWLANRPGCYRPLVYCWRGGERSSAMAEVLTRVGWRAETLEGGYRTYRRLVGQYFYDRSFPADVVLLEGNTGTAKTLILKQLEQEGAQVINLEELACHRGSLFGATSDAQPTQKAFESALAKKVNGLDTSKPVVIEAESSKIGDLQIPPSLWAAMQIARRIELFATIDLRVQHILTEFAGYVENRAALDDSISSLSTYHSKERISGWLRLSSEGRFDRLVRDLMTLHYDPRYRKHRERNPIQPLLKVQVLGTTEAECAKLAGHIVSEAGLAGQGVS